jgi:hypothetical protein
MIHRLLNDYPAALTAAGHLLFKDQMSLLTRTKGGFGEIFLKVH